MKASQLRDKAIVSIADGSKQGTVRDLVMEPNRRRVVAITVKPSGGGNDKTIPVKEVHSAGRDAITIRDADVLQEEQPIRGDGQIRLSKLIGTKALTDTGHVVGSISEVEIDPDDFAIIGYDLTTGVMSSLTGSRQRIAADNKVHYGRDVLVVRTGETTTTEQEKRSTTRSEEKSHPTKY